jgi:hypothetical protein
MRHFRNFLFVIALLMMAPLPGQQALPGISDPSGLIDVATSNFSDVGFICRKQPGICQVAAEIAINVESKAKSGLGLIYSLSDQSA